MIQCEMVDGELVGSEQHIAGLQIPAGTSDHHSRGQYADMGFGVALLVIIQLCGGVDDASHAHQRVARGRVVAPA